MLFVTSIYVFQVPSHFVISRPLVRSSLPLEVTLRACSDVRSYVLVEDELDQRDCPGTRQVRLSDGTVGPDVVHLYNGARCCSALRLLMSSVPRLVVLPASAGPTLHHQHHRLRGSVHAAALLRVRRRADVGAAVDRGPPELHGDWNDDDYRR